MMNDLCFFVVKLLKKTTVEYLIRQPPEEFSSGFFIKGTFFCVPSLLTFKASSRFLAFLRTVHHFVSIQTLYGCYGLPLLLLLFTTIRNLSSTSSEKLFFFPSLSLSSS